MNDQELLQLLASEAPAPSPGHVDSVLRRARRARRNRRLTGVGAALGVVVVLAVSGTVLSGPVPGGEVVSTPSGSPSSVGAAASDSQAYVILIRHVAGNAPVLYLRDGFCDVMSPEKGCHAGLPAWLRADIVAAMPGVRLVAVDREAGMPVVTIGEMRHEGEFAEIAISIVRDRLDGEGKTYRMKKVEGQWQVVDTVGGVWIA